MAGVDNSRADLITPCEPNMTSDELKRWRPDVDGSGR